MLKNNTGDMYIMEEYQEIGTPVIVEYNWTSKKGTGKGLVKIVQQVYLPTDEDNISITKGYASKDGSFVPRTGMCIPLAVKDSLIKVLQSAKPHQKKNSDIDALATKIKSLSTADRDALLGKL